MIYKNIKITKRKDNYWEAKFQRNNVRKSIYGKTQKECYENLKKELNDKTTKETSKVIKNTMTLDKWVEQWFKIYKSDMKSQDYYYVVNKYIKGKLKMPINKILPLDLQQLIKAPTGTRTQVTVYNILNQVFKKAYSNKLIKIDIMKDIEKPKHKRTIGQSLSTEEEKQLLERINNTEMELLIKFYLYTGVRRSEALSIKWNDINFEKNIIHIPGTKTEQSNRYIPIFPKIKRLLKEQDIKNADTLVFKIKATTATQYFARLGIGDHKLHDLRHTFATRCLEKGVSMKTVQVWLGHSNYKTTANIYSHVDNNLSQEQANLLV